MTKRIAVVFQFMVLGSPPPDQPGGHGKDEGEDRQARETEQLVGHGHLVRHVEVVVASWTGSRVKRSCPSRNERQLSASASFTSSLRRRFDSHMEPPATTSRVTRSFGLSGGLSV